MRTLNAILLLALLSLSCSASPAVIRSSVLPEPAVLVLLGGGLVGLACLVRRHWTE